MSTNSGQYTENDFTPVVSAMELSDYVFHITDNPNKFPEYTITKKEKDGMIFVTMQLKQDSLTNIVRRQAFEIYMDVFTANEINLKRHPERKQERLSKQLHAIELCNRHLAAIQLCRKKFHMSYKRMKYWGKKTRDLREVIERWHESDKDRFKGI